MALRVVLVTILLGGALAIDIDDMSNLREFRFASFVWLIAATYLATIVYGLWMRRSEDWVAQGSVQVITDIIIVGLLTQITGGLDSVFGILFYLTIVASAVLLGRQMAVTTATLAGAWVVVSAGIDLQWLEIPNILPVNRPLNETVYRSVVNVASAFLVAALAGYLSESLGEVQSELAQRGEDLKKLKALNEKILLSMNSGVLTVDSQGVVIFFNRAAEKITGLSADIVLGTEVSQLFPVIAEAIKHGNDALQREEGEYTTTDGTELFLGFSISPLLDENDTPDGLIAIFQDLTAIREMEGQIRRSEKLAAVGELSAAIAHEIRNPLASISGAVEMLQPNGDEEETQTLQKIVIREVDRLDGLISDFLNYSKPRELQLEALDLTRIIDDVLTLASSEFGLVETEIESELKDTRVFADGEATRQILWNLLRNAVQSVSGEAKIIIRLERAKDSVLVSIEDNGPGVPPELRDRVFEPFFTTKSTGTGLGLATTFRLAEQQGGTINVSESSALGGAKFQLSLPQSNVMPPKAV